VVDAKQNSAIAEITHLINKDAIRVGDGIQIDSIAPRKLFADLSRQDDEQSIDVLDDIPIVPPVSRDKKPIKSTGDAGVVQKIGPTSGDMENKAVETVVDKTEVDEAIKQNNEPSVIGLISDKLKKAFDQNLRNFAVKPGLNLWSFKSGSSSAAASIPLWIVNQISIEGQFEWNDSTYSKVSGTLLSGPTENGSALGADFGFSYMMKESYPGLIDSSVDGIEYGAQVNLASLSISDESFGGRDVIELGGLVGLYGRYHVRELGKTLHYRGGISYDLLALGRSGLDDEYVTINGKRLFEFYAEADVLPAQGDWVWGGFVNLGIGFYQSESGSLDSNHFAFGVRASHKM
jgi:hypothetical protein